MKSMSRMFLLALPATVAVLAGCANPAQNQVSYGQGKHLVYRDSSGHLIRQFDYPTEDACRRVAAMAGGARCQADSAAAQLQAKAMLLYNPPGFTVQGHYADMARCQSDTRNLGAGVQLMDGCAAK